MCNHFMLTNIHKSLYQGGGWLVTTGYMILTFHAHQPLFVGFYYTVEISYEFTSRSNQCDTYSNQKWPQYELVSVLASL